MLLQSTAYGCNVIFYHQATYFGYENALKVQRELH